MAQIILAGSEQFNQKPSKGIAFLQEQGILKSPLDPDQVAGFLRENPRLDKKMIGEYISAKKNSKVLEAFLRYDIQAIECPKVRMLLPRLPRGMTK